VLVVDGSFLQRDLEWDEVVFVDTPFEVARERGTRRDAELLGGLEQAERAFDLRYHAAGRRYLAEVGPAARATIVLGNAGVANPVVRRL
jgi:uridine kinase